MSNNNLFINNTYLRNKLILFRKKLKKYRQNLIKILNILINPSTSYTSQNENFNTISKIIDQFSNKFSGFQPIFSLDQNINIINLFNSMQGNKISLINKINSNFKSANQNSYQIEALEQLIENKNQELQYFFNRIFRYSSYCMYIIEQQNSDNNKKNIILSGADAYVLSDGTIYYSTSKDDIKQCTVNLIGTRYFVIKFYKNTKSIDNDNTFIDKNIIGICFYNFIFSNLSSNYESTQKNSLFDNLNKLKYIKFQNCQITSEKLDGTFSGCTNLLYIYGLNVSSSKSYNYMFKNCQKLVSLQKLELNINSAISCNNMFQNCYNLVVLPRLNFIKCNSYENIFKNCSKLKLMYQLELYHFSNQMQKYVQVFVYKI